jgi:hypothetical protein
VWSVTVWLNFPPKLGKHRPSGKQQGQSSKKLQQASLQLPTKQSEVSKYGGTIAPAPPTLIPHPQAKNPPNGKPTPGLKQVASFSGLISKLRQLTENAVPGHSYSGVAHIVRFVVQDTAGMQGSSKHPSMLVMFGNCPDLSLKQFSASDSMIGLLDVTSSVQ